MQLRPFQSEGVEYLKTHFRCLLADEMGLGKTVQAIGLMKACPGISKALIICPATLKLNWKIEIERWYPGFPVQIISGRNPQNPGMGVTIVNYDILTYQIDTLKAVEWDAVIVDEAHRFKSTEAAWSKAFFKNLIGANRLVFLTGTPILNRPVELWPLLYAIDPKTAGSFKDFVYRYCEMKWDIFTGKMEPKGAKRENLSELHEKIKPFMLRRLKADVLKDLPPKTREVVILGEETRFLGDWREKLNKLSPVELEAEMATQRRLDGGRKVDYVIAHVKGLMAAGERVVLFAWHKEVVRVLVEDLGPCPVIVGDTSAKDKQKAVEEFQAGGNLIIGNIMSMGVGLTLTAATVVVFAELDWVPNMMIQAEDRAHRIGQTGNVLIQYLVLNGTIDGLMGPAIVRKIEEIEHAVDGIQKWFDWKEILFEKCA